MCLHGNRAALQREGWSLAYPGRDGIPSGDLALRLPGTIGQKVTDGDVARARATLTDRSKGKPLILSEENILGRMFHFMKGQFYPMVEDRCRVLRAAWDGPVVHVVLVVRPYDELFASGYRKRAEDNAVPAFDGLRASYMDMDRGWPQIVGILRDTLAPETLSVVPYAARGTSVSLLERLVPQMSGRVLIEPAQTKNRSATDAALEALQRHYAGGQKLPRTAWKAIIGAHADDIKSRGFAEFSKEESKYLSDIYISDLKQIEGMSGVNLG